MDRRQQFFRCEHCGNLVGMINNAGVPLVCCGEPMTELIPNDTDASHEKHVPVATVDKELVLVKIGSAPHPMVKEHYIEWAYLETERGGQRKTLKPGDKPEVAFAIDDDKALAVFIYCNLHGLWKVDINN